MIMRGRGKTWLEGRIKIIFGNCGFPPKESAHIAQKTSNAYGYNVLSVAMLHKTISASTKLFFPVAYVVSLL